MSEEEKAIEILKETDVYNLGHDDRFEELRLYESALEIVLNLISNLQKKLDKKDKQIDLIIQHILLGKTFMREVCPNTTVNNCNNFYKNGGCNECIKQYFYKKVEDKEKDE